MLSPLKRSGVSRLKTVMKTRKKRNYIITLKASDVVNVGYNVNLDIREPVSEKTDYIEAKGDSQLLRQIRLLTGKEPDAEKGEYVKECINVDINSLNKSNEEEAVKVFVTDGITVNGRRYRISERSGSMSRFGMLCFVAEEIWDKLDEAVSLGIDFKEKGVPVNPAKWFAHKGLILSDCICIEEDEI